MARQWNELLMVVLGCLLIGCQPAAGPGVGPGGEAALPSSQTPAARVQSPPLTVSLFGLSMPAR